MTLMTSSVDNICLTTSLSYKYKGKVYAKDIGYFPHIVKFLYTFGFFKLFGLMINYSLWYYQKQLLIFPIYIHILHTHSRSEIFLILQFYLIS